MESVCRELVILFMTSGFRIGKQMGRTIKWPVVFAEWWKFPNKNLLLLVSILSELTHDVERNDQRKEKEKLSVT